MSLNYDNSFFKENIFKGDFGLEKESLRVDKDGFLAHTKHPFENSPNIDRDFCENQVEMITDVFSSVEALYAHVESLNRTVVNTLSHLESGEEYLWPFSNPAYVKGEADIPIARFSENQKGKEIYREYLARKYGKKKMLFSGIHFNFSFAEEVVEKAFGESNSNFYKEYKNSLYLELAKKVTEYSWLIVYLTAASPTMDGSFFDDDNIGKDVAPKYSSPRCSEIGYWNDFTPILDFESLKGYTKSIQNYIENGSLQSASELYYPVRLKPRGENSLEGLELKGINHIELRMLDLNPLSPDGIMKEDIHFLHFLIIYLMSLDIKKFEKDEQIRAINNLKKAAEFDDESVFIETGNNSFIPVRKAALDVLSDMESFFSKYGQQNTAQIIKYQKDKVLYREKSYAQLITKRFGKNYVTKGLNLAKQYSKERNK